MLARLGADAKLTLYPSPWLENDLSGRFELLLCRLPKTFVGNGNQRIRIDLRPEGKRAGSIRLDDDFVTG